MNGKPIFSEEILKEYLEERENIRNETQLKIMHGIQKDLEKQYLENTPTEYIEEWIKQLQEELDRRLQNE